MGLGLFGLRAVPLVDREAERDALWSALRGVASAGRARAVLLTGPAGLGKSRLAEWLGEHAHAAGAATPLRALHGPVAGPALGLGAMVERTLRCVDLPRPEVVTRARAHLARLGCLDAGEALALAELVRPALGAERATARLRFASPAERYLTVERWLGRLAAERPVLLWLDDVHHGREALDFTAHLLEAQPARAAPVLVVLTARPDEAPPAESARLTALAARDAVDVLDIGPLPEAARPALVRVALGVEPSLAEAVDRRTEGNPLRVAQLLGDWVERGLLVPGAAGYRLTDPAALGELDDALAVVWARRVERLLTGRRADDGHALELAAVLGREVDGAEWLGACAEGRLRPAGDLLEAMLDQGLAQAAGALEPADRWGFAHETLRAALRDRAAAAGRLAAHHAACAAMLADRAVPRGAERLGAHLRGAGRPGEAVGPLLDAAVERLDEGDFPGAAAQVDSAEAALADASAGADVAQRGAAWVLRARIAGLSGDLSAGLALCDRAAQGAATHGWPGVAVDARHTAAELLLQRGDIGEARARVAEGLRLAEAMGDDERAARCALAVGAAYVNQGDVGRAAPLLARAEQAATRRGDRGAAGRCAYWLSRLAEVQGDAEAALRHTERGLALFEEVGARGLAAACHNQRGDLLRAAGDLDGAEAAYERALARWTAIGAGNAVYAQANRAQVMLERGAAADARAQLDQARARFGAMGQGAEVAVCDVRLAHCAALLGDGPGVDAALAAAEQGLTAAEQVEPDTARQLERVATLAEAAGWRARAAAAWQLSAHQWRALGREAEATAAEARAAG
ncbi:MAG: AAA family ATPase [Myxococcales bacterium]|nr:AAA family ATPase [Myxococcales bacterium]